MPTLQRNILSYNGICYNISDTIDLMSQIHGSKRDHEGNIHPWKMDSEHYNAIVSVLIELKYMSMVDYDLMIPHPGFGEFLFNHLGQWLTVFGVADTTVEDYMVQILDDNIGSVGSFPTDDESFTLSDEECIEDDEEMELVIGSHLLMELIREDEEERGL